MANYILKNGEIILRCSKATLEFLHDYILKVIKKEETPQEIQNFIEQIDQEVYGRGVIYLEIADIIKSKKNISMLHNLVSKVIFEIQKSEVFSLENEKRIMKNLTNFRDSLQ